MITVTAPPHRTSNAVVLVHPQSDDMIQQYFTVTAPHSVFSQYLKQIKYKMLVVVHPQSDENVRLQWGF